MFFLITKLYFSRFDFFLGLIGEHILLSTIAIGFATVIGLLLGVLISEFNKLKSELLSHFIKFQEFDSHYIKKENILFFGTVKELEHGRFAF